jgi:hypothetical protein
MSQKAREDGGQACDALSFRKIVFVVISRQGTEH